MREKENQLADNGNLVNQFISVTGSNKAIACHMLEAYENDLESAVAAFLDGGFPTNGSGNSNPVQEDDNVRAPIPQTQGVLVDDYSASYTWRPLTRRSVFDGFNSFATSEEEELVPGENKKRKKLEQLFSPPRDIMYKGTFHSACQKGSNKRKWLMVNLQNVQEFACQVINRDVWSNEKVKAFIKEHFIFWQERSDSSEGERYINFYPVNKWPHVAIIDPRTGGRLVTWDGVTLDNIVESINAFLANHGELDGTETTPKSSSEDILLLTEQDQLKAAIAASLKDVQGNQNDLTDEDDDALHTSVKEEVFYDAKDSNGFQKTDKTATAVKNVELKKADICTDQAEIANSSTKKNLQKIFPKKRKVNDTDNPFLTSLPSKITRRSPRNLQSEQSNGNSSHPSISVKNKLCTNEKSSTSATKCKLRLKHPDGKWEMVEFNSQSTLKDLKHLASLQPFDSETYELVTNFPRRNISSLPSDTTLEKAGLCPQETIFIQEKL